MKDDNTKVALVDTSVLIDRIKMPSREPAIDQMLGQYDWTITTGISVLEFKAVVIQECITIYNRLKKTKVFTATRDALIESNHRQNTLRSHIFTNIIQLYGVFGKISEAEEQVLAEKAMLALELVIPSLYDIYKNSVKSIVSNEVCCTRAEEKPVFKRSSFDVNLPTCVYGRNRQCSVEDFIRKKQTNIDKIRSCDLSAQLIRSIEIIDQVINDKDARLTVSKCRSIGDMLIVLEADGIATDSISTNARDWQEVSKLTNVNFVRMTYPDV